MPSWRTFPPRRIDDPRSLRVVAALEAVGAGRSTVALPVMSATFRDELRTQLVAVTPRLVSEGVRPGTETAAPRTAESSGGRRAAATADPVPTRRPVRTRPMTVLVAGAAVVVLGLGGATWLARGALPGDALYGLKRTAEGVDVSLSGSNLDKGHALLVDAQTRVEEVDALLSQPQSMSLGTGPNAGGAISSATVKLIVSTLQAADADTRQGVTTIGDDAIKRGDHAGLDLVVAWAQGQRDRIDALVRQIPAGPAHDQATTSAAQIRRGLQRAEQLQKDYTDATCRRDRDEFGPTPCLTATPKTPAASSTAPSSGSTGSAPGGGASTAPTSGPPPTPPASSPSPTGITSAPAGSSATAHGAGRTATSAGGGPVVVDSCGVQVSLPVAGVSVGTCTPGR